MPGCQTREENAQDLANEESREEALRQLTFNDLLRQSVKIEVDKRDGLSPDEYDPHITLTLADGTEFYVSQDGFGGIQWGNGDAA